MANAKFTYTEIDEVLTKFTSTAKRRTGGHDFACGFLTATLTQLLLELPRHKQAEVLRCLTQEIEGGAP